ncbi:MAG: hypothetical protein LC122_01540 [Chitinophagales bacterium]|nr:hypothetical protein [Chitinophagales bacterium]
MEESKMIKNINFIFVFSTLLISFFFSACNGSGKYPVNLSGDKIMANYTLHVGEYQEQEVENIGRLVYRLAAENKEAKKLELTLQMNKTELEDKYGNKGEGIFEFPDKMKFDGLDEIRKYANADKYLGNDEVYLAFAYKLQSILQNVDAEGFFKRLKNRTY